jgi:hypothetical protein
LHIKHPLLKSKKDNIMDKSILQEYLNLQFIPLDDDSALDKLKKASTEIAKKLQKDKSKIISYTLVALDPQISVDDSSLAEVKDIVIKHWPVFATKASDLLVTYLRAVILEALQSIADNTQFAGIIWLTGSNVCPYYNLDREADTLKQWLESIGNVYEQEAESNWSISSELKLASLVQVTLNAAVNYSPVNSETLTTELKAASAHSSHGGEGSYTPQSPQQWSDFLAKRAGEGFAKEINRALASQSTSLKKGLEGYNTQLNEYFSGLGKYFEDISKQMILGTQSIQRRSQLLWVKEALFSVGQKMSYRDIPKSDLPFVLAKDMQSLITFIYPVSVDFFTKEILRNVITDADVRLSFSNLLDVKNLKSVQSILGVQNTIDSSRKPLINYIQRLVTNQTTIEQMENETGIKPESEISLTDFTVYLLHDLQSIRLSILK